MIILGLSLLLRLAYGIWRYPHLLPGDAASYWTEAGRLLADEAPGVYWPPGLPHWLALWRGLLGDAPWVAGLASLFWWVVLFGQMTWLSRDLLPRWRWGFLTLFSLYPAFVHQSVVPLTHLPVACLLLAGLALLRAPLRRWRAGLLGLLLGLGALFRPGLLALLPVLGGWVWWQTGPLPTRGLALLLLGLATALPLGLWRAQAPALRHRGALVNTATPYNVFLGNQPETPRYATWWLGSHQAREAPALAAYYARLDSVWALPPAAQAPAFLTLARRHVQQAPGRALRRVWNRLKVFWAFDTLAGATLSRRHPRGGRLVIAADAACYLLLLSLVLLCLSTRGIGSGWRRWALGLVAAYALPYLLAFSHPTYHLPVLPLLALWASSQPAPAWPRGWARWRFGLLLAGLLAIQGEWVWFWLHGPPYP